MYAVDQVNSRVQKFDSEGTFITKWGSHGTGDGQFDIPRSIAVSPPGITFLSEKVYVVDQFNNRVQVFVWKPEVDPGIGGSAT